MATNTYPKTLTRGVLKGVTVSSSSEESQLRAEKRASIGPLAGLGIRGDLVLRIIEHHEFLKRTKRLTVAESAERIQKLLGY